MAVAALVPAAPVELPPGVDPTEAGLPRWRRPSLLQARKTDPLRSAVGAASLTFADGVVAPYEGLERRRIRYRLVRLLDLPDDVRSTEIGVLDEGDEVQVTSRRTGTYRLVLCPDGQQGLAPPDGSRRPHRRRPGRCGHSWIDEESAYT